MPVTMRICSVSGCPNLAVRGRCEVCRRAADKARGTAAQRGYNTPGHRLFRQAVLQRDPICVVCSRAASIVADHYPLSRRQLIIAGKNPNDPSAGRGLCKPCHDSSTARQQPGGWNA